ncbi:MAG TPA: cytochrome c-type biogenesis protein CcmH [Longimicrobiaceae bacterium]
MRSVLRTTLLALLACGALAPAARAQGDAAERADAAMAQLRSPVTPSHTLDMCPAPEADALRDTVRAEAARGASTEAIVEGVIARRGEQMRIVPKRSGFGLWAWLAPPAVLLLGLGVVAGRMRAMRAAAPPESAPQALSTEDREALAAALAEWDESGEQEDDR